MSMCTEQEQVKVLQAEVVTANNTLSGNEQMIRWLNSQVRFCNVATCQNIVLLLTPRIADHLLNPFMLSEVQLNDAQTTTECAKLEGEIVPTLDYRSLTVTPCMHTPMASWTFYSALGLLTITGVNKRSCVSV